MRAQRLGVSDAGIGLVIETDLERILDQALVDAENIDILVERKLLIYTSDAVDITQRVIDDDGPAAFQYDRTEGFIPLCEALVGHLAGKGVQATADEINIASGSQGVAVLQRPATHWDRGYCGPSAVAAASSRRFP